ncbi:TlpA family protein disulfide reductase [bacterium]|nr:MAG: TlpA family protein disulfide reductase [bacterium]
MRLKLSAFVFLLQMEPWKIAVIAALGIGFISFGMLTNGQTGGNDPTNTPAPANSPASFKTQPAPPTVFAKYKGSVIPSWPNITQWVNAPTPPTLESLKGKPALIEVFRIGCSHCQEAAPYLVHLHERYGPRGVAFVGLQSPGDLKDLNNPESNWTGVQGWVKAEGYSWPVGFDAKSKWFQGNFREGVTYPTLFVLDKTGKVSFIQSGHDEQKALQLAIELERVAPSPGDANAQADNLSKFLSPNLGLSMGSSDAASEKIRKAFATTIVGRLK